MHFSFFKELPWHYMSKPNSAPPHCRSKFSLHLSEISDAKMRPFFQKVPDLHCGGSLFQKRAFLQTAAKPVSANTLKMTTFYQCSPENQKLESSHSASALIVGTLPLQK